MRLLRLTSLFLALLPLSLFAQTETDPGISDNTRHADPTLSDKTLLSNSSTFHLPTMGPSLTTPMVDYSKPMDITMPSVAGGVLLGPLSFVGSTQHYTGLMDIASGQIALRQQMGRFLFSASVMANKYWMPWQHDLTTQYGVGGAIGYQLTDAVSLHAFGQYYATNPILSPAYYPYVNTTNYGGYADIRFSSVFGTKLGVQRFQNPMTGQWTTEPIVNPYIKLGKDSKIELPLGSILKALVWGDRDNPMNYRPHPMSRPPGNR